MHPVTNRSLKTRERVAQKLSKASKGREPPYIVGHPSHPNIVLSVKLQGGIELVNQVGAIVLLDQHQLVQPKLLSDP
jgi:hypothetical protein